MKLLLLVLLIGTTFAFTLPSFPWSKKDRKKTSYNESEAKKFMYLSAAAYGDSPLECVEKAYTSNEQRRLIQTSNAVCDAIESVCSGYIIASEPMREVTVVFRGTRTNEQLLMEGWSTLNPKVDFFDMGHVNTYFNSAHNKLWGDVEDVLLDPKYQNYSFAFTGHSLGGALATLAAARTVDKGYRRSDQVRIYTFGEPRVGNSVFAKNFDRLIPNSYRIVYAMDIVPHMPGCVKDHQNGTLTKDVSRPCDPTSETRGYHHSTEIWYPECMDEGCEYKECTGEPKGEDFTCSDQYKFDLKEGTQYIWDHRHYFGVKVPAFGKVGCDISSNSYKDDPPKKGLMDTVFKVADWFGDKLGITRK